MSRFQLFRPSQQILDKNGTIHPDVYRFLVDLTQFLNTFAGGNMRIEAVGSADGHPAVRGTALEGTGGDAIVGDATGSGGSGGYFTGDTGVVGIGATGTGGTFSSSSNYALVASGDATSPVKAAVHVAPQNADPTGPNAVGDMRVSSAGVLRICTVAGSPGTWVNVGSQ